MAFIDRIALANQIDLTHFTPFMIADQIVGRIPKHHIEILQTLPTLIFEPERIYLSEALLALPLDERSQRFNEAIKQLQSTHPEAHRIMHQKWWHEYYRADTGWGSKVLLHIERAAAKTFGINGYGVHLNGYVRDQNQLYLWIAKRAEDKPTSPGKLDQMVAGGLSAELSPQAAIAKEAREEADMPETLINQIRPVSYISYTCGSRFGSRSDNLFVYDVELPADFVPRNTDGEVSAFELMSIQAVAERVENTTDFKFNCNLVVIDFLIRHGYITPEHPDYERLCTGLRQKLPIHQCTK